MRSAGFTQLRSTSTRPQASLHWSEQSKSSEQGPTSFIGIKISTQQSPIADLEHPFALSIINSA
jgi:hypothetical protein